MLRISRRCRCCCYCCCCCRSLLPVAKARQLWNFSWLLCTVVIASVPLCCSRTIIIASLFSESNQIVTIEKVPPRLVALCFECSKTLWTNQMTPFDDVLNDVCARPCPLRSEQCVCVLCCAELCVAFFLNLCIYVLYSVHAQNNQFLYETNPTNNLPSFIYTMKIGCCGKYFFRMEK